MEQDSQTTPTMTKPGSLVVSDVTPEELAAALAMVRASKRKTKHPKIRSEAEWHAYWDRRLKHCSDCGEDKLGPEFGSRRVRDYIGIQAYCSECRGKRDYRNVPRTYRERDGVAPRRPARRKKK